MMQIFLRQIGLLLSVTTEGHPIRIVRKKEFYFALNDTDAKRKKDA